MDPLQTFKKIYGQVPEWVDTMHTYSPQALQHYTDLRMEVMKDSALSRKEKELILIGVNAARRYETSMIYHTQGALDAGATVLEIADIVLTTVISRGLPAWLEGQKAVKYAMDRSQDAVATDASQTAASEQIATVEDCNDYYLRMFGQVPEWAVLMRDTQPDVFIAYTNLRHGTLRDHDVPAMLKELVLVAVNVAERYDLGVEIHVKGALAKGATNAQLAECFLTAVLTAGIPAWFMGWKYLKEPPVGGR